MTTTDPQPDLSADAADEPLNDALLLQAVRDGSTAAFGILYTRYRDHAVQVATRTLGKADPALAEDVVEVAFVRVLTALRNGKGPDDTLRAYLTTTVRREVWRAQRRDRRQAEVVDRWAVDEGKPEADPSAEGTDGGNLGTHTMLVEAFRSLSDRWRHVLWLTEIEGRKPADLAGLLGISASSAAALAYRARNGLISAYFVAYARAATDAECTALADRLGRFLAAGRPDHGFADVVVHLDHCAACRDASRGIDVAGGVLSSLAPFGVLSAGLWAKAAGSGAVGLAGAAGAAASTQVLGQAGAGSAASSATGVGVAAAVVAAVVVAAGVAWAGFSRSPSSDAAPPTTEAAVVEGASASAPAATVPVAPGAVTPAPAPSTAIPGVPQPEATTSTAPSRLPPAGSAPAAPAQPVERPAAPEAPAAPTTTAPTTTPSAPTTSTPSTTAPPTSVPTTAPPTVPTTVPPTVPVADGQLTGRAVEQGSSGHEDHHERPVAGVTVNVYDLVGRLAGSASTGSSGRWAIADLAPGRYVVVAVVPAAYRPADWPDPWLGGDTWTLPLGWVDVASEPVELVDLRLEPR